MDRSEVICEDGTYGTLRGDQGRPETNTVSACNAPGPGGRLGLLGARGPACWLAPLRHPCRRLSKFEAKTKVVAAVLIRPPLAP